MRKVHSNVILHRSAANQAHLSAFGRGWLSLAIKIKEAFPLASGGEEIVGGCAQDLSRNPGWSCQGCNAGVDVQVEMA